MYNTLVYTLLNTFITGVIFTYLNTYPFLQFLTSFVIIYIIISYIESTNYSPIEEIIFTLGRSVARYKLASEQDQNPFIKNLHANYATAYSFALRDIASDTEIESVIGISGLKLQNSAVQNQDIALRTLASVCPAGQPTDFLTAVLAGQASVKDG